MKLRIAVLPLFLLSLAWGQGVRFGDGNPPLTTHNMLGISNIVSTEPGATVNVCNFPANAVPCTNKATTYTSQALGASCPTSTQLTRGSGSACFATTDASGNWGVWLNPGLYAYTITYLGHSVGPVPFTAGASNGTGGGAWGTITGSLSAQADLVSALAAKADASALAGKANLVHTHDASDIVSGSLSPSRLVPPTANTLGGVQGTGTALVCDSGFVQNGFNSDGTINCVVDQTGGGSYTLPALQAGTLGGVKGTGASLTCGAGTFQDGFNSDGSIHCTADAVTTVAGRTGAVVIAEADVTSLVTDLAGKAAVSHTHTESQVTNLVSDLAGKAATVHTHAESDVTNLVSDLAAKALDSNTVHKTGTETVNGQKTFGNVPLILTLANGCLNITAGVIGTTGSACSAGGGAWGSITGTLSSQGDLVAALAAKANDAAVVHNTLNENVAGQKTFSDNQFFNGFLQVLGGFEITSDWPGGAMTSPAANSTKVGVDADGHFKTCEGAAACVAPAVDSTVVHNTGTENVGGVKTFTTGVKVSGISDGCLNIASGVVGGSGAACGGSGGYTNLFQTSANILTQRNGTNTQTYQVLDTYTDASNYRGVEIGGNYIKSFRVGSPGLQALHLDLDSSGTLRGWQINTGFALIPDNTSSPPDIGLSSSRIGTLYATVYNTPLADGCVEIASNIMGTRSNPCAVTPNELTVRTYAAGGGTAQAQTATLSPAATSLQDGLTVRWLPLAANTTSGPTLAVSGLTATTIKKCGTTALVANDLNTTTVATATYRNSVFELQNPQVGACGTSAGSLADPGGNGIVVRTGAGTSTNRSITGGVGIAVINGDGIAGNIDIATDSTEQGFIAAGALTCGASTNGKIKVHTTPLQYCDNATTPALQYAAYGDSSGNALTGDSATNFFSSGTLDTARLPTALANQISINGLNITASTGTLAVANGKTLSFSNTMTFAGTDSQTYTFPSTSATIARTDAANTFTGNQTMTALLATASTAVTQSNCDNSTKIATTAFLNTPCTNIQASGSPLTLTGNSGYYYNDTASAYTFQLDAPVLGKQYCFGNRKARSSAITIKSLASVTIYYKGVAGTTGTSGTLVSGGAAGDFICVVGTDTTTYEATGAGQGTWTNN